MEGTEKFIDDVLEQNDIGERENSVLSDSGSDSNLLPPIVKVLNIDDQSDPTTGKSNTTDGTIPLTNKLLESSSPKVDETSEENSEIDFKTILLEAPKNDYEGSSNTVDESHQLPEVTENDRDYFVKFVTYDDDDIEGLQWKGSGKGRGMPTLTKPMVNAFDKKTKEEDFFEILSKILKKINSTNPIWRIKSRAESKDKPKFEQIFGYLRRFLKLESKQLEMFIFPFKEYEINDLQNATSILDNPEILKKELDKELTIEVKKRNKKLHLKSQRYNF